MRAAALVLAALVVGCAPGSSIVTVTLGGDTANPIGPIANLSVTPSDGTRSDVVTIAMNGATVPPDYRFSLRFDKSVDRSIDVKVAALDGNNLIIGSAEGSVAVKPSKTATLALTLAPPAGTALAFTTQPANAAVASSIKPPVQVTVQDADGNTVVAGSVDVTIALGANPSNATLGGTLTQPTVAGVATFADLTVDTLGSGYTLVATTTGLTSATSAAFDITAAVWTPATTGLFGGSINWAAFDTASGTTAYAATTSGVFKSSDGGASWASINSGLVGRNVNVIAVDPFNTMHLMAGTTAGVFNSTDGGNSWASASMGFDPTTEQPTRIFFDPVATNSVWLGTTHPNVYLSSSTSVFWDTRSDAATPGLPAGARITGLGVDSAGVVYVTTFDNIGGMWKLAAGGTMWTQVGSPVPTNYIDSMLVDRASSPNVIYVGDDATGPAGLLKGNGTTFAASSTGLPLTFVEGIGVAKSNPQVVYVSGFDASDPFVYKSTNGGAAWAVAATGLPTTTDVRPHQSTMAVDPTDPNHVLFPSPNGLFRTTDGGASWAASVNGLTGWPVGGLTTLAGTANLVVAGSDGGGIFSSTDGGVTWTQQTIGDSSVRALLSANGKLYAGTGSQLATSPDGATWTTVAGSGTTNALAAAPSSPMTMYAAAGTTVSVSSDGGMTFGATGALAGAMIPSAIAVDPTNPMIVYVATLGTGIYRSANGGGNWGATNAGLTNLTVRAVAVAPTSATTVFAGTDGGIFRSTDGGSSWTLAGGTAGVSVLSFALHPTKANVAFASSSSGVLQSIDGGATWSPLNAGLGDVDCEVITIDANDSNTLWVGTASAGVFVARP